MTCVRSCSARLRRCSRTWSKDGQVAAIAVWFLNYSTFTGRHGIWLEDLFVREGERRHGYGRALLKALAEVCVQRGYRRFEWSVLDWNEPSIRFYRSIGAAGMDEWRIQRLGGEALTRLGFARTSRQR